MNDRMRTGMAEASRLTRAGRLAEATAVIQRTLRAVPAPEGLSTTTDLESIDAVFRVVDAIPLPTEVSAQTPDHHLSISETATLPPSDVAMSPPQNGGASAELTDTRPDLREDQHSGTPSTILHTREITRADSIHRRGLRDLLASARHFALPEWRQRASIHTHTGPGTERDFRRREVYQGILYQPGWNPQLQAIHPQWISRASLASGHHAAWLYADP